MNIVNLGYGSTNYYALTDTRPILLVDVGWSNTLPTLQHQCKRAGITLTDIPYLWITHYHPDHAGLAQEVKQLGTKLILMENQVAAVPLMRPYMKPENRYLEIELTDNIRLSIADSRAFLATMGIQGEIISTPGHSADSHSLILDEGIAFTGDLTHPMMATDETKEIVEACWKAIHALGVKKIFPGHGPQFSLDDLITTCY